MRDLESESSGELEKTGLHRVGVLEIRLLSEGLYLL